MDIRIKGAICVFIYNLAGTLAVCSLFPNDPLHEYWAIYTLLLTFPVIFISFGIQYVEIVPLWNILIIQFMMLAITLFVSDLILRNFSPAYREKRKVKLKKRKIEYVKESRDLINSKQISIYLNYPKEINKFKQQSSADERQILAVEQWFTIDNLAKEVILIKKGEVSSSTKKAIEKRIAEKLKDQETMNLLFTVE